MRTLCLIACVFLSQAALAQGLGEMERALLVIKEFATAICGDPIYKYEGSQTTASAQAKASADVSSLIKKLIGAKVELSAGVERKSFQGLLQQDLLEATKVATTCRMHIFNDLKDRLLPEIVRKSESIVKDSVKSVKELEPTTSFRDDFDGSTFGADNWVTDSGCDEAFGTPVVSSGFARFGPCETVSTIGKRLFNGKQIQIKGRFGAPNEAHDAYILLKSIDSTTELRIGDTNYEGRGLYVLLRSGNAYPIAHFTGVVEPSKSEYVIDINGAMVSVQRGGKSYSIQLPRSFAGERFYLKIGSGGINYSPAEFDYISVASK